MNPRDQRKRAASQRKPAGTNRRGRPGGRPSDSSRRRRPQPGDAGDQVEGRQAVRELLLAGRRRTRELVLASGLDPAPVLDDIMELARQDRVTIRTVGRSAFDAMTRTESAQGVLARAAPLPMLDLEQLLRHQAEVDFPFLIVLDGITDPGNLGAILRTAECAGVTGVVLPRHRSARITPTVTKAAAGAVEYLQLAVVPGLPAALQTLRRRGVWTLGLDPFGTTPIHELTVATESLALVLGAEGRGLSRLVAERCDALAVIPLQGVVTSLNVAAVAAVACFEIARNRASI